MRKTDDDRQLDNRLVAALTNQPEVLTPDCLPAEQIIALAEHAVPESQAAMLMSHVALCARCRREFTETIELVQLANHVSRYSIGKPDTAKEPTPKAWFRHVTVFAIGATAASLALYFSLIMPEQRKQTRLTFELAGRSAVIQSVRNLNAALTQEVDSLQKGQRVTSQLATRIERLNAASKSQSRDIARLSESETALLQIPLVSATWTQIGESNTLRGAVRTTQQPGITLVHPVNTAILDDKPRLVCLRSPGAAEYEISIEMEGTNAEVAAPKQISPISWQMTSPLEPGKVYKWVVTAQRGSERIRSALAKFYLLSEADKREVESYRDKYRTMPLLLGLEYARIGLMTEAANQFRAELAIHPENAVAMKWLKEIQSNAPVH